MTELFWMVESEKDYYRYYLKFDNFEILIADMENYANLIYEEGNSIVRGKDFTEFAYRLFLLLDQKEIYVDTLTIKNNVNNND